MRNQYKCNIFLKAEKSLNDQQLCSRSSEFYRNGFIYRAFDALFDLLPLKMNLLFFLLFQ
jgi:hypothetical protein